MVVSIPHTFKVLQGILFYHFLHFLFFFKVVYVEVKHSFLSKITLDKTQNETELWQKPFGAKLKEEIKPISRHMQEGKDFVIFQASVGIWKCSKLG